MIIATLLWETLVEWQRDNATRQGAALAFYALFACAPLLLVATAVAGAVLGPQAAEEQLAMHLEALTTREVAETLAQLVENADPQSTSSSGVLAGVIGVITMLVGTANGMVHLQGALNTIWGVQPDQQGTVWDVAMRHLLALGSVLLCGLLLLSSIAGTMVLRSLALRATDDLSVNWVLLRASQEVGGFVIAMLLISVVFKTLADALPTWRDVLIGAAVSSALFLVGKHAIAWYLRDVVTTSIFGAAGAVIAVLIYAYYIAQVVLFGAEFTFVHARHVGQPIPPAANAVRVRRLPMTHGDTQRSLEDP